MNKVSSLVAISRPCPYNLTAYANSSEQRCIAYANTDSHTYDSTDARSDAHTVVHTAAGTNADADANTDADAHADASANAVHMQMQTRMQIEKEMEMPMATQVQDILDQTCLRPRSIES